MESELASLQADVAAARFSAVSTGQLQAVSILAYQCDPKDRENVWIFPDGTAEGMTFCLNGSEPVAELDPFTARIIRITE